jgi:hypothetical protein
MKVAKGKISRARSRAGKRAYKKRQRREAVREAVETGLGFIPGMGLVMGTHSLSRAYNKFRRNR